MGEFSRHDMEEAQKAIASIIDRAQKAQVKFSEGTSWHSLQKNRIKALLIASTLIKKELAGSDEAEKYSKEDLESAFAPLASLISKSQKAHKKLKQGSWQRTMLEKHLKALAIAAPLLVKALRE